MRVYDADIESLSSSQDEGVGIRVIVDGRQGFAYAGSLELEVIEETLAEARDNAGFAELDEFNALATPDGVTAAGDRPVPRVACCRCRPTRRSSWPSSWSASCAPPTSASAPSPWPATATAAASRRSPRRPASPCGSKARSACCRRTASRPRARDTQTGFGFTVGRELDDLELDKAVTDAAHRATRLLGATKPKSRRLPVILDPFVTASFLGVIGFPLTGEAVLKGRSLFADRVGEAVA